MQNLYEYLGEKNIRALVDHFYDAMEDLPEAQTIRAMHPDDLAESRDKFFWFLVGWSGVLYTSVGVPGFACDIYLRSRQQRERRLDALYGRREGCRGGRCRTTLFRPSTESQTT